MTSERQEELEHDSEQVVNVVGRAALAGRTLFYALLVFLTASIAFRGGGSRQDNAHGALEIASRSVAGKVVVGGIAAGFVVYGLARLYEAVRNHRLGRQARVTTALQGAFYVALAYVPVSFLAGNQQAGSEQQQHRTAARLLGLPGGQAIVFAIGLIFIGVCVYQLVNAIRRDFTDGLDLAGAPVWVRRLAVRAGAIGISARAIVFLPIGIFFLVAAVQFNPRHADGLDAELLSLSGHAWGAAALSLVAAGFAAFVVFSALETRYRVVIDESDDASGSDPPSLGTRPSAKQPPRRTANMANKGKSQVERAEGNIKEGAGKLVGNRKLEAEGKAKQTKGNARETAKKAKDTLTQ